MSARLHICEILEKLKEFSGDGSVQKKIDWLQQHDSSTLRMLLQHNFDPNIHYNLPEGDPPFTPNQKPLGLTESNLLAESRKVSYLWLVPYDSTLERRVEAQAVEIARREELLHENTMRHDKVMSQLRDVEATYQEARERHEAKLTQLAELEDQIAAVKKAVDASRVEMSQAKVRFQTISQDSGKVTQEMQQLTGILTQMRKMHTDDKDRLKKQPASAPAISPLPVPKDMPRHRLEMTFIQTLESMHPADAKVLLSVKNKTLAKNYSLTKDVVKKAFPDLLKS